MSHPKLPPVRACIFDVDGLLINSEDIYTEIYNNILHTYGRPDLPWSIKALQQSRGRKGTLRMLEWAQLPISLEEWTAQVNAQQEQFQKCVMLPGAPEILYDLSRNSSPQVDVALASSAGQRLFEVKTASLPAIKRAISPDRRVFGNDPAMEGKLGKPAPDIFLLALRRINEAREAHEQPVVAEECLVFEDSIAGVEAGRRAGMRVVWVPHHDLLEVCRGKEEMVLMGAVTGEIEAVDSSQGYKGPEVEQQYDQGRDSQRWKSEDGRAELLRSLEGFPYERYGIRLACLDH